MKKLLLTFFLLLLPFSALADDLASLSSKDATSGLKEALLQGANVAVSQLGAENGFLGNDRLRIPLPDSLQKAEGLLKAFGQEKQAEELKVAMNRAAESAVTEAKPILVGAVKKMTVKDAKDILTGGDDAVTRYFRSSTEQELTAKFLPIVKKMTAKVRLGEKYNQYAGKAAQLGLMESSDADLDQYVTKRALDGLFLVIAEQERAIRQNPLGQSSALLKKVFGAVSP